MTKGNTASKTRPGHGPGQATARAGSGIVLVERRVSLTALVRVAGQRWKIEEWKWHGVLAAA